jgi:hypothetical protein
MMMMPHFDSQVLLHNIKYETGYEEHQPALGMFDHHHFHQEALD